MVASKKAHEPTTGLLIRRLLLLLLLLLRLSTTIEEATYKLSGNTSKTSGAAAGL